MRATNEITMAVKFIRDEEKMIIEELKKLGIAANVLFGKQCSDCVNHPRMFPSVALIRNISLIESASIAKLLKLSGYRTINAPGTIEVCSNKAIQALFFQQHHVSQPKFSIAFNFDQITEFGESLGGRYVIKPIQSSWGRGIALIQTEEEFQAWRSGRESLEANQNSFPVLVQEVIEKGNYDIRVVVIGTKPVVAFRRVSDHWKTNTHLGASVDPIEINSDIYALVDMITGSLGEGIYGVDILYDSNKQKYLLCEVNHNPEFSFSQRVHGVNVAARIAEYVNEIYLTEQSQLRRVSNMGVV
jgi:[lysine-biosynthesis-protein LysW]--L-2-aminoadipate ligase